MPNVLGRTPAQLREAQNQIRYSPSSQAEQYRPQPNIPGGGASNIRRSAGMRTDYADRFQQHLSGGSNAHQLFMQNKAKQKQLADAAASQQQLNQVGGQLFNEGGVNQGPIQYRSPNSWARPDDGINRGTSGLRQQIIANAKRYLGTPYVLGGGHYANATAPSRGFNGMVGLDCSGLTGIAFRQAGINLPALADQQTMYGVRTNISNARPGDLVGWNRGGHVGIYLGNGQIIHAPQPGSTVEIRNIFPGEAIYGVRLSLPGD